MPRTKLVAIFVVAFGALFAGRVVYADPVSDQQQNVKAIADQLDAISARIDRLDLDYNAALDRSDTLTREVADAQAKVDAQQAQVSALQQSLGVIAIGSYTSGTTQLSPLFANPASYSDAQQRSDLARLSVDSGVGDVDQAHAVTVEFENSKADLASKQKQAKAQVDALAHDQAQAAALTADYTTKYAAAQAKLGDLVQQEQARRVAEAAAKADAAAAQTAAAAAAPAAPAHQAQALTQPSSTQPPPATSTASAGSTSVPARGNAVANPPDATHPVATTPTTTPDTKPTANAPKATTPAPNAVPAAPSAPPPSSRASIVVAAAMSQLGVPYVFAAESPGVAFDCSGLTKWAWGRAGVSLPHFAASQFSTTPHVTRDQIQPGDLIYYDSPIIGHVAIYIGNGQYIHAPQTGDVVRTGTVNWSTVVGISRPG